MTTVDSKAWTDVVGLPSQNGMRFRGQSGKVNRLFVPLCVPLVIDDTMRAKVALLGIAFATDVGVEIYKVSVGSGPDDLLFEWPRILAGNALTGWVENLNYFRIDPPREVWGSLCIIFDVRFNREGNVTIAGVGCDLLFG